MPSQDVINKDPGTGIISIAKRDTHLMTQTHRNSKKYIQGSILSQLPEDFQIDNYSYTGLDRIYCIPQKRP